MEVGDGKLQQTGNRNPCRRIPACIAGLGGCGSKDGRSDRPASSLYLSSPGDHVYAYGPQLNKRRKQTDAQAPTPDRYRPPGNAGRRAVAMSLIVLRNRGGNVLLPESRPTRRGVTDSRKHSANSAVRRSAAPRLVEPKAVPECLPRGSHHKGGPPCPRFWATVGPFQGCP